MTRGKHLQVGAGSRSRSPARAQDAARKSRKLAAEREALAHEQAADRPTVEFVRCSNGCGRMVEVLYEHEITHGVTCTDCFERMTTT